MRENSTLTIAITGNIGSGKSTFCGYLQELGETVYYADSIAHDLTPSIKDLLIARWGSEIWKNGSPDRKQIASIVFNSASELQFLNSALHPLVVKRIQELIHTAKQERVFFEIPLLFEAGIEDLFDRTVLVSSSRELTLERLKLRNRDSYENQIKRLDAQIPDSKKAEMVDYLIINDGNLEALRLAAQNLLTKINE